MKSLERASGSIQTHRVRTKKFNKAPRTKIADNPTISMKKLARAVGATIKRVVNDDFKSFVRSLTKLLSCTQMRSQVKKGLYLLSWVKHQRSTVQVFPDTKIPHSNGYFTTFRAKEIERSEFTDSVMCLGTVVSDECKLFHWFPTKPTITVVKYVKVMEKVMQPWIVRNHHTLYMCGSRMGLQPPQLLPHKAVCWPLQEL